jgi:hypothetical protein
LEIVALPVKVTVPVTLIRLEGGVFLAEVTASDKDTAVIGPRGEVGEGIFNKWANEQFTAIMLRKRRTTGLKDGQGGEVFEGDIVEGSCNEFYPVARAVVKWRDQYAAFVIEGRYESGGGYSTVNLQNIAKWTVVGNVFENPDEVYPAKKVLH